MTCDVRLIDVTRTAEGHDLERYRLRGGGVRCDVLNAGCAIARLEVPDRFGNTANVVLGYADASQYLGDRREYFGAVVGRCANRIARGRFDLDGREVRLSINDGPNHLHGGTRGFDRRPWHVTSIDGGDVACLRLQLSSPDGDEGYPGRLNATVTYTLDAGGELRHEYAATTDAATLVNLTNHSYFNLAGEGTADVLEHELQVDAHVYCPVDHALIPTGDLQAVDGTPFDFRTATRIGESLRMRHPQLALAGGFDHCLALRDRDAALPALCRACSLVDPRSGRRLTVATDQPGVQFYSGNFLDGSVMGPSGATYQRNAGLCLETQHFPDSPHHPRFPSVVLGPGERYATVTTWRFDVLP
jgi:aldose 1-epimerase